jgi:YbgC/YbaW family acyl-CoA thioester hydrolase
VSEGESTSGHGAAITLQRRLEWCDTDAAARWHHSTLWRFVEAAEAELHRRLGILDRTFGFTPRRRIEAEFHTALRFDDLITIDLQVAYVGRTSATYDVSLSVGDRRVASAGVVIVFTDAEGRPSPWPDDIARALREGVAAA